MDTDPQGAALGQDQKTYLTSRERALDSIFPGDLQTCYDQWQLCAAHSFLFEEEQSCLSHHCALGWRKHTSCLFSSLAFELRGAKSRLDLVHETLGFEPDAVTG